MTDTKWKWNEYRKRGTTMARRWEPGFGMKGVSVSQADQESGSPRIGDMIARNPENPDDKWLISEAYFKKNYETAPQ